MIILCNQQVFELFNTVIVVLFILLSSPKRTKLRPEGLKNFFGETDSGIDFSYKILPAALFQLVVVGGGYNLSETKQLLKKL